MCFPYIWGWQAVKIRIAVVVICVVLNILAAWIMWEAVVKPLRSAAPDGWSRSFPAPFYLWEAPVWFWHDLAITLIIFSTAILAYIAVEAIAVETSVRNCG
jgi:hypothetical protein